VICITGTNMLLGVVVITCMVSSKQSKYILIEITSKRVLTIISYDQNTLGGAVMHNMSKPFTAVTLVVSRSAWRCSRLSGWGVLFVAEGARAAEFVVAARGFLLLLDIEGATRLGEGDGGVVRPLLRCHELVLPAEKFVFALAWQPCTSLLALQAKWNKWVIFA
jgi:hypothetical protein